MHTTSYREALQHLTQALGAPRRHEEIAPQLDPASDLALVRTFVEGNLEKRLDKLRVQLKLLEEAFPEWETLLMEYIRSNYSAAYDTIVRDGERMLRWLRETQRLTDAQRDYVACQAARHAVEDLAAEQRSEYLRFDELRSIAGEWALELAENPQLRPVLNPIRHWIRLETPTFLEDAAEPPAQALFFAVQGEIATAIVELEGQAALNELADFAPASLADWQENSALGRERLLEICQDFAEVGLIAFA